GSNIKLSAQANDAKLEYLEKPFSRSLFRIEAQYRANWTETGFGTRTLCSIETQSRANWTETGLGTLAYMDC
ncbi:MAG: hypothetical protein ACERKY_05570, partial [Anaerolineales bacterium]